MSSRATVICVSEPICSAILAQVFAKRLADSKNTKTLPWVVYSLSFFESKNPQNVNESVGTPAAERAVMTDDAPGMGMILICAFWQSCTRRYPGSEISGVPASETIAIVSPAFKRSMIFGIFASPLWSL